MEEKELAYYLEDLNRIHELSLEKLGEWKEKYPYSQVVHFLMAKKHQVEGFVDDMSVYHKASFYAVDRDYLQERMTRSELEIGSPDSQSHLMEAGPSIEYGELEEKEIEGGIYDELPSADIPEISEIEEEVETSLPAESQDKNFTAKGLSEFAQWVVGLGGTDVSQANIDQPKKKKKKKKKKSKLEKKIEKSLIKKDEIITEPLANILAQQGHTEKAIEMYQKLSLIFPEKSSFFALQIEKLK